MTDSATAPDAVPGDATAAATQAFADRVFGSVLGAIELLSIHLGDRLGWYRALDESGPLSSAELAERTGTVERYAREWLEQQAVNGILTVDEADAAAPPSERRFALPAAHAEVLVDTASLDYMAPIARMITAAAMRAASLVEAYRGGGGVSWEQYGDDAHESQADVNRPWFERRLGDAVAAVAELDAVLSRPGARIADIGCGHGWSTLALARAYPSARVVGIDVDEPSIAAARANAEQAGLADRVEFRLAGGEELSEPGAFDAAFVFEALHDMPR
ncbi:MAG TPA: methyltransferase domain-containing protein, partial [Agromyces mariniharenae]|nr:methyltransferase domain-containing protein [Agromyces mariniharenae]